VEMEVCDNRGGPLERHFGSEVWIVEEYEYFIGT